MTRQGNRIRAGKRNEQARIDESKIKKNYHRVPIVASLRMAAWALLHTSGDTRVKLRGNRIVRVRPRASRPDNVGACYILDVLVQCDAKRSLFYSVAHQSISHCCSPSPGSYPTYAPHFHHTNSDFWGHLCTLPVSSFSPRANIFILTDEQCIILGRKRMHD